MVKKVITKKMPRKTLASPIAALALPSKPGAARATKGRIKSSTHENTTTSDEIMMGTMGRALMAPAVAMAADTPQMEMPEASGAAHSRESPKYRRDTK